MGSARVSVWNYQQHAESRKEVRLGKLRDAGVHNPDALYAKLADESNRVTPHSKRDWRQKGKRVWVGGHNPELNANAWLRECYDAVKPFFGERVVSSVPDIAKELADKWGVAVAGCGLGREVKAGPARAPFRRESLEPDEEWRRLITQAEEFLDYLNLPFPGGENERFAMKRLGDARWWRRQLSVAIPRIVDHICRKYKMVHKSADCYVSEAAFDMWQRKQRTNREVLENMVATNDYGQEYTLAELAGKSMANPKIKRTELMVRLRGLEEWANDNGYEKALFITLTCPSKYHSHNTEGIENVHWNYANPRTANSYLNGVWARIRARLAREEVEYFGIRVAEPHHDGCPHWHLLLWMPDKKQTVIQVESAFHAYGLAEDGGERGAADHRVVVEDIDPEEGSAVGYIAKYIAKNIDGANIGDVTDVEGNVISTESRGYAQRISAWSSIWGIRQFQFFGCPPIGIWREFRRVRRKAKAPYELARVAADKAEFRAFIDQCYLHDFGLYFEEPINKETGEVYLNRFGEVKQRQVIGVRAYGAYSSGPVDDIDPELLLPEPLITRLLSWTVKPSDFASEARSDEIAKPRTCVSNCTGDLFYDPDVIALTEQYLSRGSGF